MARNTLDSVLWQFCQDREIVLVTRNRTEGGPDSLEATIQRLNTASSLSVFTLASADRILVNRPYAERVADRFLEYLFEIDNFRGTGRLWLP